MDNTRFRPELIAGSVFVAPGAVVLGDVTIGPESSVWFQAVIRGDTEMIRIGQQTNIQDACVLHADPGFPCLLGDRVTVGHAAIVHGAVVDDDVMIGMRAVVMNVHCLKLWSVCFDPFSQRPPTSPKIRNNRRK